MISFGIYTFNIFTQIQVILKHFRQSIQMIYKILCFIITKQLFIEIWIYFVAWIIYLSNLFWDLYIIPMLVFLVLYQSDEIASKWFWLPTHKPKTTAAKDRFSRCVTSEIGWYNLVRVVKSSWLSSISTIIGLFKGIAQNRPEYQ